MDLKVRGAKEHNLKNIDVDIGDGLTVITGVSGSGKTSLVFDTIYHESRRRFNDVFSKEIDRVKLIPANVDSIIGIRPTIAVGQNILNRNPLSNVATASGLHPFLRLLYARFGDRLCPTCGEKLSILTEDEMIYRLFSIMCKNRPFTLFSSLVRNAKGSHRTLLKFLSQQLKLEVLYVDGLPWNGKDLDPTHPHNIEIKIVVSNEDIHIKNLRKTVKEAQIFGSNSIIIRTEDDKVTFNLTNECVYCGTRFGEVDPIHFHTPCPYCRGKGCEKCNSTGLHPKAAFVRWEGLNLIELLSLSIAETYEIVTRSNLPSSASRLKSEIERRLKSLSDVGLGYIHLDRPSPSLSRGEAQRVRIAVSLTNSLEDILHILDEPTIGQHPYDVSKILPIFQRLPGPVIYIEHDRAAAAYAHQVIDLGPKAGEDGGHIIFKGTPAELWKAETDSGRYFSFREKVPIIKRRIKPTNFISIFGAYKHNLQNIDVSIPLNQLTVITGVSGSGKSTLVEDVLVPTFKQKKPIGCKDFDGSAIKPVLVDQNPIGKNPRSNPATYTKVSDIIRDLFARETGLSLSHFSFNRSEGACPKCKGMGAVEVKMRYLPSTWIICSDCNGQRFSEKILSIRVSFGKKRYSISDFYKLSISQANSLFKNEKRLTKTKLEATQRMLNALETIGLGYLSIGQPSPTLSGGEAQRVKLAKFLGKKHLSNNLIILDEPTTGLHPKDLKGLILVLNRLLNAGATIIVVEHNTDIIKTGDWIIDLGPGAGSDGGRLIYSGPPEGLIKNDRTAIGRALKIESNFKFNLKKPSRSPNDIIIKGARANNLKNIDVCFKKYVLNVVTGVSGSGKSSLIRDVLETEARRRFLETLSLYERQGISEGPEAPVNSVSGLGVSVSITPGRRLYRRRSTVGTVTEIRHHLAVLYASIGESECGKCGTKMQRHDEWFCPNCKSTQPLPRPKHFKLSTYSAACSKCNGVGTIQIPVPGKLIIKPEKSLCKGAMYSPGFFPKGYICKPYNGGYYIIKALADRHNFDPFCTPWKDMSSEAKKAFLFGDPEPLEVNFESRKRQSTTRRLVFKGFYGWVGEWDVGGTYTEAQKCERCGGAGLKPEFLAVKLRGYNIHQLNEMPLSNLLKHLTQIKIKDSYTSLVHISLNKNLRRLQFLVHVGLSYLNLNRVSGTLSAGEAQRIRLAGLLGSELTSLTILLDEPSRGMHPSEVEALLSTLKELRDLGNTVIVVEHDPVVIQAADNLVDVGPGPGVNGGEIVAVGEPEQVAKSDTVTARWLRNESRIKFSKKSREPKNWLIIKGAKANNLQNETVSMPLGSLVGLCGVSGSGKSTLLIDTVGRALAPKKQTTSVAYEPIKPGEYESIEGAPERIIILDQVQKGIRSPGTFLGLFKPLVSIYANIPDAKSLGLTEEDLSEPCSACRGKGVIRTDMGFLPDIFSVCETCRGSGRSPEAWEVRYKGIRFPELNKLTIDEVYELFQDEERLAEKLKAVKDVGLGYLVLSQPGYSLSGGEAQRLRIAKELSKIKSKETLYILDEPTVGQHMEDIDRLIGILHRLVDEGNSVIVIEHHPHLLAACDWLIELGPGGDLKEERW